VSLTTPGLTDFDSDRLKELKEEDCCPIDNREELPYGRHMFKYNTRRRTATCEYCTDSALKAPTRTDEETSVLRETSMQRAGRGCSARKGPPWCGRCEA
jgi:hypothetical protein